MCYLHLKDMPEPLFPFNGTLTLGFEAAKGEGVDYLRKYFGVDPEVVGEYQE